MADHRFSSVLKKKKHYFPGTRLRRKACRLNLDSGYSTVRDGSLGSGWVPNRTIRSPAVSLSVHLSRRRFGSSRPRRKLCWRPCTGSGTRPVRGLRGLMNILSRSARRHRAPGAKPVKTGLTKSVVAGRRMQIPSSCYKQIKRPPTPARPAPAGAADPGTALLILLLLLSLLLRLLLL